MRNARAFSPASIGNVGVGFDILGLAIAGAGDTVTVTVDARPGVRITAIRGSAVALPQEAERNTAGRALLSLLELSEPGFGFSIEIDKGIPYGSGMGGSAASAVAALVAANALLAGPLGLDQLYRCALDGEAVASGGRHGDNVAPMLLGGWFLRLRRDARCGSRRRQGYIRCWCTRTTWSKPAARAKRCERPTGWANSSDRVATWPCCSPAATNPISN